MHLRNDSALSLRVLGPLRLTRSGEEVLPGRRKELVLLAYLARRAPAGATRAELATLLWGERGEERGRQSLRQALLRLRRAVGDAEEAGGEVYRAWLEEERARLGRRLVSALEQWVAAAEAAGEWSAMAERAERWVGLFPDEVRPRTRLIMALQLSGRSDAALAQHA